MRKKLGIILACIVGFIIILIGTFWYNIQREENIANKIKYEKELVSNGFPEISSNITEKLASNYEEYKGEEIEAYKPKDIEETLKYVNEIMNSLIIANDGVKWGYIEPTEDNLNIALRAIEDYLIDFYEVEQLLNGINAIIDGEYERAVEVHNLVWNLQGGTVGEAVSINYDKVNEIKGRN